MEKKKEIKTKYQKAEVNVLPIKKFWLNIMLKSNANVKKKIWCYAPDENYAKKLCEASYNDYIVLNVKESEEELKRYEIEFCDSVEESDTGGNIYHGMRKEQIEAENVDDVTRLFNATMPNKLIVNVNPVKNEK